MTTIQIPDSVADLFEETLNGFLRYGKIATSKVEGVDQWEMLLSAVAKIRAQLMMLDPQGNTQITIPNLLLGMMTSSCITMAMLARDTQKQSDGDNNGN